MLGKMEITGTLEVLTGMHIGGSSAFAAIGAVDSPVVRDTLSDEPMVPGSSLKGKIRALLAQQYNGKRTVNTCDEDDPCILRLFGSAKKGGAHNSRLIFRDLLLSNLEELRDCGVRSATEVKFENGINRLTSVANPRQIERTIRGSKFALSIVYNSADAADEAEAAADLALLAEGMELLQYDYLGGHGSRGYGRVKFTGLRLTPVLGEYDPAFLKQCQERFDAIEGA